MFNPLESIRKFQSRLGKPIRPIIEIQKNGSVVSIITNTIQTENMIQDQFRNEAWELHPDDKATALYIDGVFKGIGYFAGEEGQILKVEKHVELFSTGTDRMLVPVLLASYKGLMSKLLDASLLERASALKPSLLEKLIFCGVGILIGVLMGMSYGS